MSAPSGDTTPLFHAKPVLLNANSHGEAGLKPPADLGFARATNAIPLGLEEISIAQAYFPIIFPKGPVPFPVAVVGLADGRNLFVGEDGTWPEGTYLPAYLRRYPFILAEHGAERNFSLCVEEECLDPAAPEERRFFKDGAPTPLARQALDFCGAFQRAAEQARAFAAALAERGLLVERRAEVELNTAAAPARMVLDGLLIVDEARLRELPDAVVVDWQRRGWLAAVHAHLMSQHRWTRLMDLAAKAKAG